MFDTSFDDYAVAALPYWDAFCYRCYPLICYCCFLVYPGFDALFTNLGASGRSGPTSLGGHYTGQDHDGQVTLSSGIQHWTVPFTGEYRIEAIAAAGGYGWKSNNGQYRGRGARMTVNTEEEEQE